MALQFQVPRLLAISPPTGSIHPETILTWQRCKLDRFRLAVLIREPHHPLSCALNKEGRLAPLIRGCLETNIPMLLSANFSDLALISQLTSEASSNYFLPPSELFSLRTGFVGFQFRGDPSHNQLDTVRRTLGTNFLIGASCHGEVSSFSNLSNRLVDYRCFAPVFSPQTPQAGVRKVARGIDQLESWCQVSRPTPVLALGGVSPKNADACMNAGAFGLAGIGQFFAPIDELHRRSLDLSEILQRRAPE